MTVTEYPEAAKDDWLSRGEIADFAEAMPWYSMSFVEDFYDPMDGYDVEVGTLGFLLDDGIRLTDWTTDRSPFQRNCLFERGLVDTGDGAHPYFLDDSRKRG